MASPHKILLFCVFFTMTSFGLVVAGGRHGRGGEGLAAILAAGLITLLISNDKGGDGGFGSLRSVFSSGVNKDSNPVYRHNPMAYGRPRFPYGFGIPGHNHIYGGFRPHPLFGGFGPGHHFGVFGPVHPLHNLGSFRQAQNFGDFLQMQHIGHAGNMYKSLAQDFPQGPPNYGQITTPVDIQKFIGPTEGRENPIAPPGAIESPINPYGAGQYPLMPVGVSRNPMPIGPSNSPMIPIGPSNSPMMPIGPSNSPMMPIEVSQNPLKSNGDNENMITFMKPIHVEKIEDAYDIFSSKNGANPDSRNEGDQTWQPRIPSDHEHNSEYNESSGPAYPYESQGYNSEELE